MAQVQQNFIIFRFNKSTTWELCSKWCNRNI